MIYKAYENFLDSAKSVILPASNDPSETELELFLLTKDINQIRMARVWGYEALHRRRLVFKNGFRPAKRYLYFKSLITLLRRRRAQVSGNLQNMEPSRASERLCGRAQGPTFEIKSSTDFRESRASSARTKSTNFVA